MGLLGVVDLDNLSLLLSQQRLEVVSIRSGLVGAIISQLQLASNVVIVLGNLAQVLLQLDLDLTQLSVSLGQLLHLSGQTSELGLVVLDGHQALLVVGRHALELSLDGGEFLDGDIILLHTGSQLLVNIIVGHGQLHDLFSLDLASVLQLDVGLVGTIQRHLQLSDGDGHLLLDDLNLVLQLGLTIVQLSGQNIDLINQFLLVGLIFSRDSTELLVEVSLQLSELLLQNRLLVESLGFVFLRLLVSTSQFLSLVSNLPVVTVKISEPLLKSIQLSLVRLKLILQLQLDLSQRLVGHLHAIHLVAHLNDFSSTGLRVLISLLPQVGHLLQLDGKVVAGLVRGSQCSGQLLNHDLVMLEVLDEHVDFIGELSLSILLESINFLNTETGLILVLFLPVSVLSLPLGDGSLQVDLDLPEFLNLNSKDLDIPLQSSDLSLSGISVPRFSVGSPPQLFKLCSELVL